jgi:type II secretory pathway component PulK
MERKNKGESPSCNKIIGVKTRKGTRTYITNHGYVLIFSLWAIVIFGFIAVSFTRNTTIAIKTEITFTERVKNIYAARGACIYATQKLLLSEEQGKNTKSGNVPRLKNKEEADPRKKNQNRNRDSWVPSNSSYSLQIGNRDCEVSISDESGKINVNKITDDTRASFIKFLTAYKLEELVAETITDSLLDWLDEDDLHHMSGAEKDFYATLPEPYEPKNGLFESLEELTLVKGITPQIFEMLRDHLTIYGSGKVNVNFASKEVLLYVPTLTDEMAHAIIRLRKKQGRIRKLDTLKEIFRHFGIIGKDYDNVRNYLTLDDSNYITINSIVSSGKIKNSYKLFVLKGVGNCEILAAYPE